MGQKEKLIQKLKSRPKDLTYDEVASLLKHLGFKEVNKGKTSGSRVEFFREGYTTILLHKPHPRKELLQYQIKAIIETLEMEGLI